MRSVRGIVLAIVATLMLLGTSASIASANPGTGALAPEPATASADPGDPGFPPDE